MENKNVSINGAFVTEYAREKCYNSKDVDKSVEILMKCFMSEDLTENDKRNMSLAILDGRAEFRGTYPEDDYRYVYLEQPDEKWRLSNLIKLQAEEIKENKEAKEKLAEAERNLDELTRKFSFICDSLPVPELESLNNKYLQWCDEFLVRIEKIFSIGKQTVDEESGLDAETEERLEQIANARPDDYGWLAPDGTFYPVPWGEHAKWAEDFMTENFPEENISMGNADSILYAKGWALLDSPKKLKAMMQISPFKNITKQQKEFLYDYYKQRGRLEEANALYTEK